MRITWRKQPSEKGLAAVAQGPRGFDMRVGGKITMYVRPMGTGMNKYTISAWYYYGDGVNSLPEKWDTPEEAKEAAKKYFVEMVQP